MGIWGPTDPRPTPPIYIPIGGTPETPNVPTHPIYLPVYPAHPIVLPPGPPVEGGPPVPTHPIVLPPGEIVPAPPELSLPIYFPIVPDNTLPDVPPGGGGEPQPPLVIWGPDDPRPTPPIYIPIQPPGGVPPAYIPVYPWHPISPGYGFGDIGAFPGDPGYAPPVGLTPTPVKVPPRR